MIESTNHLYVIETLYNQKRQALLFVRFLIPMIKIKRETKFFNQTFVSRFIILLIV